jgi:hypothetical protein
VLQIKPRTLAAAQPSHLVKTLGHGDMMTLHTLGEKQPITSKYVLFDKFQILA